MARLLARCAAKVLPQLVEGVPTAGEDCGVRTTQRAIQWASCSRVKVSVKTIRQRMGKPTGPTNPPDWLHVLEHPDTVRDFAKAGLQPPVASLRGVSGQGLIVGSPIKSALKALGDGKMICVAESYQPWHGTRWAGSDVFTGNHAVSYLGISGDVGDRTSTRFDSLADGRRAGIARGPNRVPWARAVTAMGDLELNPHDADPDPLGRGAWAGMVVKRAAKLDTGDGGTPTPPDCEELQADYDRLEQVVEDVRIALADAATELAAAAGGQWAATRLALLEEATGDKPEPLHDAPVQVGVGVARDPEAKMEDDE